MNQQQRDSLAVSLCLASIMLIMFVVLWKLP